MTTRIAVRGAVGDLGSAPLALLLDRGRAADAEVECAVRGIIEDVRARGDDALREQALRFDGVELVSIEIPRQECAAALDSLDPVVRAALEQAASAIETFHRAQLPQNLEFESAPGVRLGRRVHPIDSVGVYAPGGRAAYPSSVLMGVVPARVAGVPEVVVCSPAAPNGRPPQAVLAACALAGADRVFAIGGAGAIAALALGTSTVPRVARIVGPGNAYVAEAKRQLTGVVAIDCPAGPSEILVIADDNANPRIIAMEMLAQAEHDPDAAAVLVATSEALCDAVLEQLDALLPDQPRREIIEQSLARRGGLLYARTLEAAAEFTCRYAPEHLMVLTASPRAMLPQLRNAGTIFFGASSSVVFGDYTTGANHVLPTAGLARAYSGLSVLDFVRWTTYQELAPDAAARLSAPTAALAQAEGLPAHASAARVRATASIADAKASSRTIRFRPANSTIKLYDPERKPIAVDLSDNTNLFGVSPAAIRALSALPAERVTRYPSVFADDLKRELARLHNVGVANVTTGCGSDDVIDSALRAFCEPGDIVAYAAPTFSMFPLFVEMNAAIPRAVPLGPGFELDARSAVAVRASVTYICSPNNPTGNVLKRSAIEHVAEHTGGVVLLDEAYADFADNDQTRWASTSDRLVSLRTLSKSYGLAGLRIGYAVGPAPLISEIEKARGPYKISAPAEAAALAVLREDRAWVADVIAQVRVNRERLAQELVDLDVQAYDSAANFLLMRVPDAFSPDAADRARGFAAALAGHGVAVRAFPALPQAGDCIRVSIGPWPMLESFLAAMRGVLTATQGVA
ncbi:MAG: histidinol dehydrogenase [Gemmatimonadota bacterium]|nr:histidinol dehydrogenase [Gemmatimonadota bacterium]